MQKCSLKLTTLGSLIINIEKTNKKIASVSYEMR